MYERLILWLIFLLGGVLGYRSAEPLLAIVIISMLLTLPRFVKDQGARTLSFMTVVSAANALIFATAAYAVGRGVAWLAI